ncbi:MAG: sigma factor-like helix-turn-helix DNA-binding protein, partial [Sphingobacterium sp.]
LTQKEIAKALNISRKSVENQLTIALKRLKAGLSRYMFFFIFFLMLLGDI